MAAFSDSGHLNPMLAVAQHLERAGHEVVIVSLGADVTVQAARAHLRARCARAASGVTNVPRTESQRSLKMGQRLANRQWLKRLNQRLLLESLAGQLEALRPLIREVSPDAVVTDAMAYAGAAAAELAGLPWASLATGLQSLVPDAENDYAELAPQRDRILGSLGVSLQFRNGDVTSPWLDAMFTFDELVPHEMRPRARLVGPALPLTPVSGEVASFPFERLPVDTPIVYVAFGSIISHPPAVYEAFAASTTPAEAYFVLALKDLIAEPFVGGLPSHVLPTGFAPQLPLLERCAVMVNHGGANSVHECLAHGRPMIVLPLVSEHALLARLVERAGVGVVLDPATATASSCRAALMPVLAKDAPQRERAADMMRRGGNGAARVADLLGDLADRRDPLM